MVKNYMFAITLCMAMVPLSKINAQWSTDPSINNLVCADEGSQTTPAIVSDGNGGAYIAWHSSGMNGQRVYMQHISNSGNLLWGPNGIWVGNGSSPQVINDGSGNVIISWRLYGVYIYCQKMDSGGTFLWNNGGIPVCTILNFPNLDQLVTDGAGGVIIAWEDRRSGEGSEDIFAQRINSSGNVVWANDGIPICSAINHQGNVKICSDGTGGVIAAWQDKRNGIDHNIYSQRVNGLGTSQWLTDGVAVCTSAFGQFDPSITTDGNGGAIIAWVDSSSGLDADIYTQRISNTGINLWTSNGLAICNAIDKQHHLEIVDYTGGAVIIWEDWRDSAIMEQIYAQKIDTSGILQWTSNGHAVSTDARSFYPQVVRDDNNGVIISWIKLDSIGDYDIYAQRVGSAGIDLWATDGVVISNATDNQWFPYITKDDYGGAIITWSDFRNGMVTYDDIYAQRISSNGGFNIGIEDLEWANTVQLYPNPAIDFIAFKHTPQEVNVKIMNIHGEIIMENKVYHNEMLDIRCLHSGVYFVWIENASPIKIIKY